MRYIALTRPYILVAEKEKTVTMDPHPLKTIEKFKEIIGFRGLRSITKNRKNIIHFLSLVW